MATGDVDNLLVRLLLRLDAENGPALILATRDSRAPLGGALAL